MSDITKCSGEGCPLKEKCVRFISTSNRYRQSFFVEVPGKWCPDVLNKEVWECDQIKKKKNTFKK